MTRNELLEKVGEVYPGEWPLNVKQARKHEIGDGLADFLFLELWETCEDDADNVDFNHVLQTLRVVLDDVKEVVTFVENLKHKKGE